MESVVETLAKGSVPRGSNGYMNNFFTTFPLLTSFNKTFITLTGTFRKDRVKSVPLSDLKKRPRGKAEIFQDKEKDIVLCHWNDNSDVLVATNISVKESFSMSKCKRWSKQKKE